MKRPYLHFDNILLLAFAQFCIRYGLFEPFGIDITLNLFGITLIVLATMGLFAAANVILSSKNVLTEKKSSQLFILFNVLAVGIGFYLSHLIQRPKLIALFIIVSAIIYMYSNYLKEILVVKNLTMAFLMGLGVLAVPIFDLLPAITPQNQVSQKTIFLIVLDYAIFTTILIFIREIVKDCISMDSDHNQGNRTIPIVLGKERTAKLISIASVIPLFLVIYYLYSYLFANTIAVISVLIGLVAPLLFIIIKSWNALTTKDFERLKLFYKLILIITSFSLLGYQYILK